MTKSILIDHSWDKITAVHGTPDMVGTVTFVCGQLVRVTKSKCTGSGKMAITKATYYNHRILEVETCPK